jgi:inosine-uridine nucleoside N-ribohydrolase
MQEPAPQKIIIDTDPGIDDAMAIHQAFADPRLEVVGLTTIFGNVTATRATRNALHLAEMVGHPACVAGGAPVPLRRAPVSYMDRRDLAICRHRRRAGPPTREARQHIFVKAALPRRVRSSSALSGHLPIWRQHWNMTLPSPEMPGVLS